MNDETFTIKDLIKNLKKLDQDRTVDSYYMEDQEILTKAFGENTSFYIKAFWDRD